MPFVERRNGIVCGVYPSLQEGYAEEWLEDNDPELLAYLNPPPTAQQLRDENFRADPARIDWVQRLKTATPSQIETFVNTNVTNLAQARTMLIAIAKVLAVVVKE